MEILVKVQIDLSDDAKSFIGALFQKPIKAAEQAAPIPAPKPVEQPKPAEAEKPVEQPKPAETAKPKPVETAKPKPAETVKPVEQPKPAEATITLADVRQKAAPLIESFRAEIMNKLRELGAVSVSTLDSKHYVTMFNFLNTLQ